MYSLDVLMTALNLSDSTLEIARAKMPFADPHELGESRRKMVSVLATYINRAASNRAELELVNALFHLALAKAYPASELTNFAKAREELALAFNAKLTVETVEGVQDRLILLGAAEECAKGLAETLIRLDLIAVAITK